MRDVLSLKAFMILSANPLQNISYILRCSRFGAVSIVEYLMKRYYSNPTKLSVEGQSWSCRRQSEFNLRCEMVWFALSTKIAGTVFALLQADLFSRLIGIINDKRLCKTRDKKSAPIPGGLKPALIVDPKRYVQCLYQNKAVEHWYISIGTFQKRMQPRFACKCSWVWLLVSTLGYLWYYRSAFIFKWVGHVDFNFEISHWCS